MDAALVCAGLAMHVDGQAVRTCVLPVAAVAGKQVLTIEGLGTPENPHPIQAVWGEQSVAQCGYCQSGQVMAAAALLAEESIAHRARCRYRDGGQHLSLRMLPTYQGSCAHRS